MYPFISKCNAKRYSCCKHICCKSTTTSSFDGRQFSVGKNSDLALKSTDVIYVYLEERRIVACNMLVKLVDF